MSTLRQRLVFRARRFLPLLAVFAASFLLVAAVVVAIGLRDRPHAADLAVVLGNEVYANGQPAPRLAARLDRALEVYRAGQCRMILVSGGVEPNGQDEAKVMAAYLRSRGVAADRLIEDNRGIDTFHTAQNTRRVLREHGWRSVCVVTQYFHVARSCYALKRFGVSPVYSVHARYFEWRDFFAIPRELAGMIKYAFRRYPGD